MALVQGPPTAEPLGLSAPATSCWPAKMPASAPEVTLGLVPAVISPYVVRAMGCARPAATLSAGAFDAITACRPNVVHRLSQPDQLLAEDAMALRLCRNGPRR